ncbi:unnamed protein product, partial [Mesorhabditis spiculigera]
MRITCLAIISLSNLKNYHLARVEAGPALLQNTSDDSLGQQNISQPSTAVPFNFSRLIGKRKDDWRDAWDKPQIIWSPESRHHPDWGRHASTLAREGSGRVTKTSKFFSFLILGAVIGFVLYTYFAHVLLLRR